jgi:hypothetical protein
MADRASHEMMGCSLFSLIRSRVDDDVTDLSTDNLDSLVRRIYCDNEVFVSPSRLVTIGNPCD